MKDGRECFRFEILTLNTDMKAVADVIVRDYNSNHIHEACSELRLNCLPAKIRIDWYDRLTIDSLEVLKSHLDKYYSKHRRDYDFE